MKTNIKNYKQFGECLFIENGDIVIGVPLTFGLRISYISYKGSENLFFEQPENDKDYKTDEGWSLYGGHRLWIAPESDLSYYPDNEPISYEICDDKITIYQKEDKWLNIKKSMEISFEGDNIVCVNHKVQNVDSVIKTFAPWGVSTMAGGGVEYIPLRHESRGYQPFQRLTWWPNTNIGDERIEFSKEFIKLTNKPLPQTIKLGVGHPNGSVKYVNKGVVFEVCYKYDKDKVYPDQNVSYETYLSKSMLELETLAPLQEVAPNQIVCHLEKWRLNKE